MKSRFAICALLPFALAACEDLQEELGMTNEQAAEAAAPQPSGPPAVSPIDQPIELEGGEAVAAVNADTETLNTKAFSARGNEPFWSIDVSESTVLYKTPENQAGRSIAVRRLFFAGGVEYVGELNGRAFALTIRGTDCVDSMSGQKFPMSASLQVGGKTNPGCAAPAGKMPAAPAAAAAKANPAADAAAAEAAAAG